MRPLKSLLLSITITMSGAAAASVGPTAVIVPGTFNVFQKPAQPMDVEDAKSVKPRSSRPLIETEKVSHQIVYGDLKMVDLLTLDEEELEALKLLGHESYRPKNTLDYLLLYAEIESAIQRIKTSNLQICIACVRCEEHSPAFSQAQLNRIKGIYNECQRNIRELEPTDSDDDVVGRISLTEIRVHNANVALNSDILTDFLRLCC